ncbi:zinc ribbon domain-containing protein [Catenovulum sediminis]|uniref:Zinc ribbon domain-containing protein n=1 Tax=Catenovulum sediminis TaxID=1740262 RepID=A0ABV1RL55_9ALTE|nr:zinc ribbon domain-containing protein [Catenovulum sediminis]
MALTQCPECNKRISDKADQCPYCQCALVDDPEKLETQRRINRIKKSSSLMTHSFLALILFISGLAYSSWYAEDGMTYDKIASQAVALIGLIWYLTTRIRIMLFKRNKKQ